MDRQRRTAEQLRAMVQVRLNALPEVAALMATKPRAGPIAGPVRGHERDELGRNWDIDDFFQGAGYGGTFRQIVDRLRSEYDLE